MKVRITWQDPFGAEDSETKTFASEHDMLIELTVLGNLGCKNIVYEVL